MRRTSVVTVFVLWLLAAVGCPGAEDGAPLSMNGANPELAQHMRDHYASAVEYRDWVIADDMERTRPPAVWLADHLTPENLPSQWAMFGTDMRGVAAAAAEAKELPAAARALSALARTCARCHEAHGVDIPIAPLPAKPFTDEVGEVMFQHQLAANRLWEGLFIPSDTAWKQGCDLLERAELRPAHVENLAPMDDQVEQLEANVQQIAIKGAATADPLQRGQLYAELVQTCATCHRWFAEH